MYFRVECLSTETENPNYPQNITENVEDYLPGQIYDADDQCYMAFETSACDDVSLYKSQFVLQLLIHMQCTQYHKVYSVYTDFKNYST